MPRQLLIARAGALGDLLLLRPLFEQARKAGWEVLLVAPARPAEVVVNTGPASAQGLLAWDGPDLAALLAGDRASPDAEARLRRSDAAIVLSRSAELRRALEARVRRVLSRDPLPPPGSCLHAAAWAVDAAAPLLAPGPAVAVPDLVPGAEPVQEAQRLLSALPPGFLALHPGSGSRSKNWPASRFLELARRLAPEAPCLLVGGPADAEALAVLGERPGGVIARDLPLLVLAAVLREAGLLVGNDSGISHLAAASGTPTLALFGPTRASGWRPLGQCVETLEAPAGDLEQLGVDAVEQAARSLWRAGGHSASASPA